MPHLPLQRRFTPSAKAVAKPAAPAPEPQPQPEGMQAIEVVELAAEEAEAVKPVEVVLPIELQERRRFTRPIPVAQVTECDENESWELWSQWSSL